MLVVVCVAGQRTEIDVFYEPGEREASETAFDSTTIWATILGSLSLLILTITLFICFMDKPNRAQSSQSSQPATNAPTVAAPATPDRNSPAISNEQSPRTPQPFVDYVRQTIDETPYYKREGRRRFNVQNTFQVRVCCGAYSFQLNRHSQYYVWKKTCTSWPFWSLLLGTISSLFFRGSSFNITNPRFWNWFNV